MNLFLLLQTTDRLLYLMEWLQQFFTLTAKTTKRKAICLKRKQIKRLSY